MSYTKTWTTSPWNTIYSNSLTNFTEMVRQQPMSIRLNIVLLLYLMVCFVLCPVLGITVSSPAEVHSVRGDAVTLTCTFTSTSRATSRMSVDWSYRPQSGGPPQAFFHFSSLVFPPRDGQFNGRVKWLGSPARGVASIQLLNTSLSDNGTYTCSVRNPPDVHGFPTSQTVLTVTPEVLTVHFSDVAVLLAFILLPSTIITLALLGRMCCPPRDKSQTQGYHSPIEVTPGGSKGRDNGPSPPIRLNRSRAEMTRGIKERSIEKRP
ncbi:myelin protein zero-like protein 3 isoform X2 [Oncorhynchus keta]|uniref:myelin protein zero-like protein 3 isoform X2 n=1 Tax=Oncorhynchus keta TaxID=8018 RepID=UPI00227BDA51|nr:myelin protein zero-like protein 3 isoform X2 [Oncorhynchus keta]